MYQRIYDAFRSAILSRHLAGGARVPPTRELASFYGVGRITVLQAYEQLTAEGYLVGRRGSGTFVAVELPEGFMQVEPVAAKVRAFDSMKPKVEYERQLPFLSGCPDLDLFPRERWLKLYQKRMLSSPDAFNALGARSGGVTALQESIAAYLATHRGVVCSAEQVLILSGSQPGIDLVSRVLGGRGTRVAVENPSYRGIARSFRGAGAEVVGIDVDREGMRVSELARLRKAPQIAVVTPSRQFPLGYAMPVSRRAELIDWSMRSGSWILEDDYDSEFRFQGNPLPAMQGMDVEGRTLYLGTFSRSMFPDLRIGYLVVPERVRGDFLLAWQSGGMNPPSSIQATLAEFMRSGAYLRHVRKMRQVYSHRCAWLERRVTEELGRWLEVGLTDGGLHFVAYCRESVDTEAIAERCRAKGVELVPLSRYAVGPLERDGFLLGFSCFSEATMERALRVVRAEVEG